MKTLSYYNTWLSAGMMFADARDNQTGQTIRFLTPRYSYDVAINYDDKKGFKAMLKGRYVWWNQENGDYYGSKYKSFIFDMSAAKRIATYDRHSIELFASAHNLFNGSQTPASYYATPQRWAEIGLRYKF
jgi:vitamin B12 transporter